MLVHEKWIKGNVRFTEDHIERVLAGRLLGAGPQGRGCKAQNVLQVLHVSTVYPQHSCSPLLTSSASRQDGRQFVASSIHYLTPFFTIQRKRLEVTVYV